MRSNLSPSRSTPTRDPGPRAVVDVFAVMLGLFLVVRAVVELVVVDYASPAAYRDDWGGPSLLGVLAVHCGPGLLVVGWTAWRLSRRTGR